MLYVFLQLIDDMNPQVLWNERYKKIHMGYTEGDLLSVDLH